MYILHLHLHHPCEELSKVLIRPLHRQLLEILLALEIATASI